MNKLRDVIGFYNVLKKLVKIRMVQKLVRFAIIYIRETSVKSAGTRLWFNHGNLRRCGILISIGKHSTEDGSSDPMLKYAVSNY